MSRKELDRKWILELVKGGHLTFVAAAAPLVNANEHLLRLCLDLVVECADGLAEWFRGSVGVTNQPIAHQLFPRSSQNDLRL